MNENEQNESLIDGHTESFFQDQRVLKQLIMNIRNISVTTMLLHLTWQNMSQSEAIITEVLAKIVEFRSIYNEINVYLKLLFKLFTMKDSISHDRIIKFLDYKVHSGIGISPNSFFEVVYRYKDQHTMFTILIILWWGDLLANKHIYDAAQPYYHRYKWMLPFINCIGFNKYIPQKYPVDYAGSVRNVIEDLHKLVIRFDPQNSSDSESSVEIEIGPEDEFPNNDLEPEPSPKEIKEEESTESD